MSSRAGADVGRNRILDVSRGSVHEGGQKRPAPLCVRSRVASAALGCGHGSTSRAAPALAADASKASAAVRRQFDVRLATYVRRRCA